MYKEKLTKQYLEEKDKYLHKYIETEKQVVQRSAALEIQLGTIHLQLQC